MQRLMTRITVRIEAGLQQFAIAGDDLGARPRFAPSLRLDGVDALGADEHVIDVEIIAGDVVKHAATARPQSFQVLTDDAFAMAAEFQFIELGTNVNMRATSTAMAPSVQAEKKMGERGACVT